MAQVKANIVATADRIVQTAQAHGYARPLGNAYYWGCNGSAAPQAVVLYAAYETDNRTNKIAINWNVHGFTHRRGLYRADNVPLDGLARVPFRLVTLSAREGLKGFFGDAQHDEKAFSVTNGCSAMTRVQFSSSDVSARRKSRTHSVHLDRESS